MSRGSIAAIRPMIAADLAPYLVGQDGSPVAPDAPGTGVTFDWDRLAPLAA